MTNDGPCSLHFASHMSSSNLMPQVIKLPFIYYCATLAKCYINAHDLLAYLIVYIGGAELMDRISSFLLLSLHFVSPANVNISKHTYSLTYRAVINGQPRCLCNY